MTYRDSNDIEFIFNQDSRDKKRIGIGVTKRASRRGYCRGGVKFPSDFLTRKQKKELNGEVRSYNMYQKYLDKDNINLDEILSHKKEEVVKILKFIKSNYTSKVIGELFNKSQGSLYNLYKTYGIEVNGSNKINATTKKIIFKMMESKKEYGYQEIRGLSKNKQKEELKRLLETYSKSILAEYWGVNSNTVTFIVRKNDLMDIKYNKESLLEEVEKYKSRNMCINEFKEEKKKTVNNKKVEKNEEVKELEKEIEQLKKDSVVVINENRGPKVLELEKTVDDLTQLVMQLQEQLTKSNSKPLFTFEVNGTFEKNDVEKRLLNAGSILDNSKKYKLTLVIKEVEEVVSVKVTEEEQSPYKSELALLEYLKPNYRE